MGKKETSLAAAERLLAERNDAAAAAAFRRLLQADPANATALRGLGIAALRQGRAAEALEALERCRQLAPKDAEVHFLLGNLYQAAGRHRAAVDVYRLAAALAPGVPEVLNNLGSALIETGEAEAAIEALRRTIRLRPQFAEAHNTLGNALMRLERLDEAEAAYRAAVAHQPALISARVNRGHVLIDLGRTTEAIAEFATVIAQDPGLGAAHNGNGLAFQREGRHEEAIACFQRAIARDGVDAAAIGNLAISLQAQGRHEEALARCREAAALRPDSIEVLTNLGHILQSLGRHGEAAPAFARVLELEPRRIEIAPYLLHSRLHLCEWPGLDTIEALTLQAGLGCDGSGRGRTVPPFALAATAATPELRLKVARHSAAAHARQVSSLVRPRREVGGAPDKRPLRVGYVSPDFRSHSVAIAFRGLLAAHDRRDFEWFGYSLATDAPDALGRELERTFHAFRDISRESIAAAADRIVVDGIDVLVDLAGHTRGTRLEIFALRPAAVQAHYLGYGATIGADYIPWLITDPVHTPPGLAPFCSEALVYLPHSFMAASPAMVDAGAVTRAAEGLPEDALVVANFNAHYKFDPATFALWMRLLKKSPDSVLWLRSGHETAMANLRRAAEAAGVAGSRLVFAGRLDHPRHLARHRLADFAVDTRHHTGGVTTLDALWAGLPVATLAGAAHSERTGASILSALGVAELIADDEPTYEALLERLALDPAWRRALAAKVAERRERSPLFDMKRLARHLEDAYRRMWQAVARGEAPKEIRVAP